jgi:hypothetical protein
MSERQLRDALRRRADEVDVDGPPWGDIEDRAAALRPHRRFSTTVISLGAVAAVVLLIAAAVVFRPGTKGSTRLGTQPGETTTVPEETTTTTAAEFTIVDPASVNSVYPFATRADLDGYRSSPDTGYADPRQVAWSFAHKFLGMANAVTEPFQPGSGREGTVVIRPEAGSLQATTVSLHQVASDAWTVVGAKTNDIQVDVPAPGATTGSPVHVAGQSTAFEATIRVEVWTAGTSPQSLGTKPVMGGSNGQMGPFRDDVPFAAPSSSTPGAVVLSIISAKDGSLVAASVVGLTLSP